MINLSIIYRFFRIIYRFSSIGRVGNLPIIYRFSPAIYRFSRGVSMEQRPIFDRRNPRINRSGCRNRNVESSDNRQKGLALDQPRGLRNHQLIVNQFHVIINSAALNPSTIHQQNARIHQRAGRPPAIRSLESSDNHPTKRRNHPIESVNLPTDSGNVPIRTVYRWLRVCGDHLQIINDSLALTS